MWKLGTARTGGEASACIAVADEVFDLAALARDAGETLPSDVASLFVDWPTSRATLDRLAAGARPGTGRVPGEVELLAPILYPGKIVCAGANYYDHMAEMGFPGVTKESQRLFFFMKPPRQAIVGPGETVVMPRGTQKFDWEIELAAVIGRTARYVSVAEALDHVAGYTVSIDLSARDFNMVPDQFYKFDWVAGKAGDTCCPIGPWFVPADAVPDPQALSLRLWVDGEIKQDGTSAQMIHSVAEQIARASEIMTLEPGDLVLTGTPAGVGVPRGEFLKVGSRIDAEIGPIGRLSVSIRG